MDPIKQPARRKRYRWWLIGLGVLFVLLLADYLLYPRWAPMSGANLNRGENGLWVRYKWYFGQHSDAEVARLAQRLRQGQFRYAYCHVRYIQSNGQLKFHYPESARRLVSALHRLAPGVKVVAWVYVGAEGEYPPVNLADATVRRTMLREARWLIDTCGFDGIQWDYEVCHDNDQRLVTLLRDTRAALPKGTFLSVCTAPWYPAPIRRWYGWSDRYFAQVAAECDQLAVMAYDSGIYLPRGYAWFMRRQVTHATQAAVRGNPRCRVIIGVPTYEDGGASHHANAETLRLALKGVREGLANPHTARPAFEGIALFADYTTSEQEWREYQRDWVGGVR